MTKPREKEKFAGPMVGRNLYRFWKHLLVLAVLVLAGAILYFWSQASFVVPMPLVAFDEVTSSVAVFVAFLGVIAFSFFVQYYYGSIEKRRGDVRARTPILVLLGFGVGIMALVLRWWIDPSSSPRSIVSYVVHKPLVVSSAAALVVGGLALAFMLSSREDQRRVLHGALFFLAAFLVFGGPTYLIYVLQNVGLPYAFSVSCGLIAFVAGLLLFLRLMGKQSKLGISE